ncbi:acetamidase/formamidase family protein [Pseudonocardia ailaonensis]|uniref:Acetamidase/formamidase family protein n=1 Tax=Pseudonocardia ailaonensis TaxID=367279 RepID=A0ABN2NAA4_9PSEU
MTTHTLHVDRSVPLAAEPHSGHNRFHPDIVPLIEVAEGDEVVIECRDGVDGQLGPGTTIDDLPTFDSNRIHPLTGPVFVKGAEPGDVLEVEFLDIVPEPHGFTCIVPDLGFLREEITTPFLAHWDIADGFATSQQVPGVRIPGASFMGLTGVAPSARKLAEWVERDQRCQEAGGAVLLQDPVSAVPQGGIGAEGLRTWTPRENGGNMDCKLLTKGAKLMLPVFAEGALFSTGDAHFAQGDGEVCCTAVEMAGTPVVRFTVHKGLAEKRTFAGPVFSRTSYYTDPRIAAPEHFLGVMGMPINEEGDSESENLTLAAKNAVRNMIVLLQERGFSREQAYVICSVAVDLRISNVVDYPNFVVSALLPEMIFG